MAQITVRELESLRKRASNEGKAITHNGSDGRGAGVLRLRVSPGGRVAFYYRYTDSDGRRDDLPIGTYAADGRGGLTLKRAGERVAELQLIYRSGTHDIRQYLEAEERKAAEQRRREAEEQVRQQAGSLKALVEVYAEHLKDSGKASWREAQNALNRHVVEPFPDLAERRANMIEPADLVIVFDRMSEAKHTRQLGKVRSYLHAAYAMAMKAPFKSTIPAAFRAFAVSNNPVAPIPTYGELSKPGDCVLSHAELRELLRALAADGRMIAKALLAGIYLGGQRPAQVLRVTASDVDQERGTITLRDGKGKRQQARLHVLPLEPVEDLINECLKINPEAPSLFSTDGERSPHPSTASKVIHDISGGAYRLGDVRRTCETELARMGVSKDLRAQILSHGLSGVQDRHYDRHLYIEEKTDALRRWKSYLNGLAEGVVMPMRRGA